MIVQLSTSGRNILVVREETNILGDGQYIVFAYYWIDSWSLTVVSYHLPVGYNIHLTIY